MAPPGPPLVGGPTRGSDPGWIYKYGFHALLEHRGGTYNRPAGCDHSERPSSPIFGKPFPRESPAGMGRELFDVLDEGAVVWEEKGGRLPTGRATSSLGRRKGVPERDYPATALELHPAWPFSGTPRVKMVSHQPARALTLPLTRDRFRPNWS